jgi:hypothetical protein
MLLNSIGVPEIFKREVEIYGRRAGMKVCGKRRLEGCGKGKCQKLSR